jgi:CheY-like chemotaxis protein
MHSSAIFLVDQDLISSMVVKSRLVQNPFLNVSTFRSGQECVVNLQKRPAVIILDYSTKGLHGRDGSSTLKELKRSSPNTHVILLSNSRNREAVATLAGNSQAHVTKGPNFSSEIRRLVERMVGEVSSEQRVA